MDQQTSSSFRDSTSAPGIYQVCTAHTRRYCRKCGTLAQTWPPSAPSQWAAAASTIDGWRRAAAKAKAS
jgi:hypothetical protein